MILTLTHIRVVVVVPIPSLKTTIIFFAVTPRGYARGKGHHESPVHRNPYDTHDAYDAIRTQDADLAVSKCVKIIINLFFFKFSKF